MKTPASKRFYAYVGSCLTCDSLLQIETKQNFGEDHYIQCPICDDPAVPSVSLLRVAMGKDDENKEYTITVRGPGARIAASSKELTSN